MVFVGMCTGNIIGPLLYSTEDAPLYRKGLIADLIMFVTVGVICVYVVLSHHPIVVARLRAHATIYFLLLLFKL